MRILFLTDNFPPEVNAPATRTYEHCLEWVKAGHEVTIITCVPNFPKGKVFSGYKNKWRQEEVIDGIRVIRVWSYIAANSGFIKRVVDFTSYAIMAFWVGLFVKTDVIIGTSPQFFTAISARLLSFFKRDPWVMEVRDLWPESIAAVGAMEKESFLYNCLHRIEKHLYKSASLIVPVTASFKSYIIDLGNSTNKIHVITNGVDRSKFPPLEKNIELLEELGLKDKFLIGYIGTHGMAHALDFILDCAQELEDDHIHIILQGDGAEKINLLKKARRLGIKNVSFLPFVSKSEIAKYISILDVCLVNLKKSDTFKTVIPSKIFENASMEKPILLGVEGEAKEIVDKYNAGVCFKPESKESFIRALEEISKLDKYKQYKTGCSLLAKDFERKNLARKMIESINEIVE